MHVGMSKNAAWRTCYRTPAFGRGLRASHNYILIMTEASIGFRVCLLIEFSISYRACPLTFILLSKRRRPTREHVFMVVGTRPHEGMCA